MANLRKDAQFLALGYARRILRNVRLSNEWSNSMASQLCSATTQSCLLRRIPPHGNALRLSRVQCTNNQTLDGHDEGKCQNNVCKFHCTSSAIHIEAIAAAHGEQPRGHLQARHARHRLGRQTRACRRPFLSKTLSLQYSQASHAIC